VYKHRGRSKKSVPEAKKREGLAWHVLHLDPSLAPHNFGRGMTDPNVYANVMRLLLRRCDQGSGQNGQTPRVVT
jgi:hypothetical protein